VVSVPSVRQRSVEGDLAAHILVKRVINEHQICKCGGSPNATCHYAVFSLKNMYVKHTISV
jgi:hypothetical protein